MPRGESAHSDRSASASVMSAVRLMRKHRGLSCESLSALLVERGQNISRSMLTSQETGRT